MNSQGSEATFKKIVALALAFELLLPVTAFAKSTAQAKGQKTKTSVQATALSEAESLNFTESDASKPYVPPSEMYPDGALQKAKSDELEQIRKLEKEKEKAEQAKDEYEQHKKDVQADIQAAAKKTENLKVEQEKIQQELNFSSADLAHIQGEYEKQKAIMQQTQAEFDKYKNEYNQNLKIFEQKRISLQKQIEDLDRFKAASDAKIGYFKIESQKIQRGISLAESETANVANQKAHLEENLAEHQSEFNELQDRLAGAKKRLEQARNDYNQSVRNFKQLNRQIADGEKEFKELESMRAIVANQFEKNRKLALTQSKKLEQQTLDNNSLKLATEAEKAKYKAEYAVLTEALAAAKARNEVSHAQLAQERDAIIESRMSYENEKTNIAKLDSQSRKEKLESDTLKVKMRTLASVAANSDMGDEPIKMWIMDKSCFMRISANLSSKKANLVTKDSSIAGQISGDYIKVLNLSGRPLYMPKGCVHAKADL